jgi:hypothetical protein
MTYGDLTKQLGRLFTEIEVFRDLRKSIDPQDSLIKQLEKLQKEVKNEGNRGRFKNNKEI